MNQQNPDRYVLLIEAGRSESWIGSICSTNLRVAVRNLLCLPTALPEAGNEFAY